MCLVVHDKKQHRFESSHIWYGFLLSSIAPLSIPHIKISKIIVLSLPLSTQPYHSHTKPRRSHTHQWMSSVV